jgi:hypothetical protein
MYGQRRSRISGVSTGTRSLVVNTQWIFNQEKVFATWGILSKQAQSANTKYKCYCYIMRKRMMPPGSLFYVMMCRGLSIRPYPTGRVSSDTFPGTSCLATFMQSLRDKIRYVISGKSMAPRGPSRPAGAPTSSKRYPDTSRYALRIVVGARELTVIINVGRNTIVP